MTSHRIGVNLRVSGNCDQGARKYMEDNHVIKFLKKDTDDYEFAYFGIFDGHGGPEASAFCRDNLLNEITKYEGFWTNDDDQVLSAIRKGFIDTHNAMWTVLDSWPKTLTGLPSTSGSTVTIAIVKQGKLYTGHAGDSGLVLGENDIYSSDDKFPVQAICLTKDHKPDDPSERSRIENAGGEVINKSGVPRVVWSRPKINHKGPIRRSTQIDQIPFLAVARSLGDLWSYDYYSKTYIVSPEPDVSVISLDPNKHRCLVLASDGLWNMLTPEETVKMVIDLETQFEQRIISDPTVSVTFWSNPAERLVARALNKWRSKALKADNTSCIVVLIDPLGPSKLTLLKRKRQELLSGGEIIAPHLHKLPPTSIPTEVDHGGKSSNQNANCSLSDSHIRVTDESMIRPLPENMFTDPVPNHMPGDVTDPYLSLRKLVNDYEERMVGDEGPVSHMFKALKQAMKRPDEEDDYSDMHTLRHGKYPVRRDASISGNSFHEGSESFTRLHTKAGHPSPSDKKRKAKGERRSLVVGDGWPHKRCEDIMEESNEVDEEGDENEELDIEGGLDICNVEEEIKIPVPPPCTPRSDATEMDVENESDCEDSLHSSANVTDVAFSLASDESLESPKPSIDRPTTPNSAPAKLSLANKHRSRPKSTTKRQLNATNYNPRPQAKSTADSKANQVISSQGSSKSLGKSFLPSPVPKPTAVNKKSVLTSPMKRDPKISNSCDVTQSEDGLSPFKRVLNTSRSMNDVITPKTNRSGTNRAISCSGLTPDMDMLMVEKTSKGSLGTGLDRSITRQLISTIMAEDKHKFKMAEGRTLKSDRQTSMIIEDTEFPLPADITHPDPLRQHNKTGPIRKTGSKRFSKFLKASKISLDNVFRKNKQSSASTGKLEVGVRDREVHSTKNTSVSTSKLSDFMQTRLPDITLSHFADVTLDASNLTAGDLTNLSALSAEDSMLSATDLEKGHHSLVEEGVGGKKSKHRKGFLQKTRFTLRRARKAAKKAFLPENNHPLHSQKSSGTKRKSDEFLPTPELKRRKQLMADKV